MDYQKESYITERTDVNLWENHANVKILETYKDYLKGSLLDIGCNTGTTTYWLKNYDLSKITGIDINSEALGFAKDNFKKITIPYNFINLDLTKTKLNETFDTITSFHTLEHIYEEDLDFFLTNTYDMLKWGGYLILSIPYQKAYYCPTHVVFYNEKTLNSVMIKNGFTMVECFRDERWNETNLLTALYKK